mgnify:CR=1 FL=1
MCGQGPSCCQLSVLPWEIVLRDVYGLLAKCSRGKYMKDKIKNKQMNVLQLVFILNLVLCMPLSAFAECNTKDPLSQGQVVYVPAYSHIYIGNREQPFLLTVTLSIRNIDPEHEINVTKVEYYATQGELLTEYVDDSIVLKPLESIRYVVPQRDESGGSGANFIVEWNSEDPVNIPIVEAIMIGTQMQQGVSFTSRGRELLSP